VAHIRGREKAPNKRVSSQLELLLLVTGGIKHCIRLSEVAMLTACLSGIVFVALSSVSPRQARSRGRYRASASRISQPATSSLRGWTTRRPRCAASSALNGSGGLC
jgi:hypothetical protein